MNNRACECDSTGNRKSKRMKVLDLIMNYQIEYQECYVHHVLIVWWTSI